MVDFHYLDSKWVRTKDLKISAFDLAVLRGYGAFDYLRVYKGKPFMLDLHIERFLHSIASLKLEASKTKQEIEELILEGIKKNQKDGDLSVRLILTGSGVFMVMYEESTVYPDKYYENGIKAVTFREKRVRPDVKSINYETAMIAANFAKEKGAFEAIFVDDGKIYEGTNSNFFVVIDKELITPKFGVLKGVTRQVILDLARKRSIEVIERDIELGELSSVDEVFIASTRKEIMPVIQVDDIKIGNGQVGDMTNKLMEEFRKLTKK